MIKVSVIIRSQHFTIDTIQFEIEECLSSRSATPCGEVWRQMKNFYPSIDQLIITFGKGKIIDDNV